MERRRLVCGDAYSFQGDERHVMFISLVVAADEGRRMATLTQAADERRFNVAASRARDQMWLFHSVMPDDLPAKCLRRALLEYCLHPQVPQDAGHEPRVKELAASAASADRARVPAPPPFESWLEVDVYLEIKRRGYRVLAQHTFAGYKIDLVVTGTNGRVAIECDGEDWLGQDRYDGDMARQRQLERCGWRFWRVRGGAFYRNPEAALQALWDVLEKQGIRPAGPGEDADDDDAPSRPSVKLASMDDDEDAGDDDAEESDKPKRATRKRATGAEKPTAKRPTRRKAS
jgi:very-short-patch-repair endonuclease